MITDKVITINSFSTTTSPMFRGRVGFQVGLHLLLLFTDSPFTYSSFFSLSLRKSPIHILFFLFSSSLTNPPSQNPSQNQPPSTSSSLQESSCPIWSSLGRGKLGKVYMLVEAKAAQVAGRRSSRRRGRRRRRRRRKGAVVVKKAGEDLELGKMRTRSTTKPTSPTPDRPTTTSCPLWTQTLSTKRYKASGANGKSKITKVSSGHRRWQPCSWLWRLVHGAWRRHQHHQLLHVWGHVKVGGSLCCFVGDNHQNASELLSATKKRQVQLYHKTLSPRRQSFWNCKLVHGRIPANSLAVELY